VGAQRSTSTESAYVIRGAVAPEAMASSLRALLPARHRSIARHRFTVLDTVDGRVRRSGTRLTRSGSERSAAVTWQPRGSSSQLVERVKQPVHFAWDLPRGPLQQALTPTIGARRLLPQADAEEYGSLLEILDDQGKTVARLRIASGRARLPKPGSGWQPLPTVITLTGLRGYEDVYRQLVPVIESRPGVETCRDGFHGVMLDLLGVPESRDLSTPYLDLAPTVRADAGARRIQRALLTILVANEPGLRANLDTEFLHDFRVAVRRTRSLLRQIRHVFPADAVEHFSTEFSWLGRLTGGPRDVDVLVLALRDRQSARPDADVQALTTLLTEVQQQEHQALVASLDDERCRRLVSEWAAFLDQPPPAGSELLNAERPLADVIAERAWCLCRRIARAAGRVDEHTTPEQLHALRIDAKKLRYLIDVAPAFDAADDLECLLGALKNLQRLLGAFNDCCVQQQRLLEHGRAIAARSGCESAVLAIGRLADEYRQRHESLRAQAVKALARFRSRDTRAAARRVFRTQGLKEQRL
jgi:CHAD domain-containing protein